MSKCPLQVTFSLLEIVTLIFSGFRNSVGPFAPHNCRWSISAETKGPGKSGGRDRGILTAKLSARAAAIPRIPPPQRWGKGFQRGGVMVFPAERTPVVQASMIIGG